MAERKARAAFAARAMWSGTITFGLVSIPVDLFPAVHAREIALRMVDVDGRALGRQYYCPKDDKILAAADLVRGFEVRKGKYIVVTDAELDAIAPALSRDIELRRFVPLDQIPPKHFDHPYVLAPSGRSRKAYDLLAAVISRSDRVGLGTFVMRGHQYLAAILSDGAVLRAQTLRFPDELRSPDQLAPATPARSSTADSRSMAKAIKANAKDRLVLDDMTDRYAAALHRLASAKAAKGIDVIELEAESTEGEATTDEVVDLMEALRQRLKGSGTTRQRTSGNRKTDRRAPGKSSQFALADMTKSALLAEAKKLRIAGRTGMSRPALLKAIRQKR